MRRIAEYKSACHLGWFPFAALRKMDGNSYAEFRSGEAVETDAPQAPKRGRGRPPGSRNKVSRDARELLAKHGDGAIATVCRLASGKAIYGPPGADGKRHKIQPTLDQRIAAAKIVIDRLVPTLKATELSGSIARRDVSNIDRVKAVYNLLAKLNLTVVPGRVTAEEKHTLSLAEGEVAQLEAEADGRPWPGWRYANDPRGRDDAAAARREPVATEADAPAEATPAPQHFAIVSKATSRVVSVKSGAHDPSSWRYSADAYEVCEAGPDVRVGWERRGDQFLSPEEVRAEQCGVAA